MLRTIRSSRSLPSLRSTAMAQAAQPVMPVMPVEFQLSRTMATSTKPLRTRKSAAVLSTESSSSLLAEPKKRGRPRKNTLTPTTHKRSNSTDSKPAAAARKSKKGDPVPTIPQPPASEAPSKSAKTQKIAKEESNVPTPADKYQAPKPEPKAQDSHSTISTSNPDDLGTRVQAVSRKNATEAERFAQEAVSALESTGEGISKVQDLLKETLHKAGSDNKSDEQQYKYESSGEDIPKGEKNVLLSMLGLTGLWVVFGGKFQKKASKE